MKRYQKMGLAGVLAFPPLFFFQIPPLTAHHQLLQLEQPHWQGGQPAVAEVEAGGFGFFVFGDEAEGEGGHGGCGVLGQEWVLDGQFSFDDQAVLHVF